MATRRGRPASSCGRTLYVAIGVGDVVVGIGIPGAGLPNPNGPSSPIFSSVLAVHFSARSEKKTAGFTLSSANQAALASGQRVTLQNGGGDVITIEVVANFPDYIPNPLPAYRTTSAPPTHTTSWPLATLFTSRTAAETWSGRWTSIPARSRHSPSSRRSRTRSSIRLRHRQALVGQSSRPYPTGIDYADGKLLVTLFRGFPFPAGMSVVEQVDPETGEHAPFITGLRAAIDVIAVHGGGDTDYLLLEHSTAGGPPLPPFANSGAEVRRS